MEHQKDSWGLEHTADKNCIVWDLKEGIGRALDIVYNYLREWCGEDGVRIVLEVHSLRKRSKDMLEHRKFQLIISLW